MESEGDRAAHGTPTEDRRELPRAAAAGLRVDFEDEIGCPVLDVSANALSILARDRHVAGSIVRLTLHFEREVLVGTGAIQALGRPRDGDGAIRYGVRLLDRKDSPLAVAMPRVFALLRACGSGGVDDVGSVRDALASAGGGGEGGSSSAERSNASHRVEDPA